MQEKLTSLFGSSFSKKETPSWFDKNDNLDIENDIAYDMEASEQTSMLSKMKVNITETIEVEVNYTYFAIVMGVGAVFILLSFFSLPLILFKPGSFSSMFSIGSLICLSSFIFIYGTMGFLSMLFNRERIVYTLAYLISIICGFIFSYLYGNYVIVLVCAVVEMITVSIFILSFIPGGHLGIQAILAMLKMPFSGLIKS